MKSRFVVQTTDLLGMNMTHGVKPVSPVTPAAFFADDIFHKYLRFRFQMALNNRNHYSFKLGIIFCTICNLLSLLCGEGLVNWKKVATPA